MRAATRRPSLRLATPATNPSWGWVYTVYSVKDNLVSGSRPGN